MDIERIVRRQGLASALYPPELIRQLQALAQVVDPSGSIVPSKAAPFRTPLVLAWPVGVTGKQRSARAGTGVLLAAHANAAPTTGDCIVSLTEQTATSGTTTVAQVRIPINKQIGEDEITVPILAGGWYGVTVTTANGASGISVSLTVNVG